MHATTHQKIWLVVFGGNQNQKVFGASVKVGTSRKRQVAICKQDRPHHGIKSQQGKEGSMGWPFRREKQSFLGKHSNLQRLCVAANWQDPNQNRQPNSWVTC
jgi:hypothetical protein